MRRMAILALIPLFSAPVAAQEAGDPQAGAAYAKQYCAKCHAIADEDASPEQTAPRFKDVANSSGMTATDGLATDLAPDNAQYHCRAERHGQRGCLYPQPKGLARRSFLRAPATCRIASSRGVARRHISQCNQSHINAAPRL